MKISLTHLFRANEKSVLCLPNRETRKEKKEKEKKKC